MDYHEARGVYYCQSLRLSGLHGKFVESGVCVATALCRGGVAIGVIVVVVNDESRCNVGGNSGGGGST